MCANATPPSSTSPFTLASTGRSLLSKLTSPLNRARSRNLTDFYIRPDEPHRRYAPGDLVKGAVVLTVVKPVRLTHLTVCLHGLVRVFKHPSEANDPAPELVATSNPKKSQYFGNGHASLFQDEQTLCGEGRLDAGVYEFNFELEFPSKGLPSSIDFERGTISYMITATITRPTSIAATSSCDKKLSLIETVDVGLVALPKPRTISLEPISRRARRRKAVKSKENASHEANDTTTTVGDDSSRIGSPLPDESASQCGSSDHTANPRTPLPNDIQSTVSADTSAESTISSSTGLSFRLGPVPSTKSAHDSIGSKVSLKEKTITATIELLKSGCLPGDHLPLKISIKHTKAIKSLHGIIITFYRQGRIDSAPPLSLFTNVKGKEAEKLKHEDYYPKSKTGLSGLSLTSAGSCSVFRKDLAQTLAPILVDPISLTSEVSASVRVPEDVFPTISGVPGQMISFKYHVEVVVDLGGKLAGQQRHVPRVSAVTNYGNSSISTNQQFLAAWGGNIVDTDHIRREKSVVACLFEVVVGTIDSSRKRVVGGIDTKIAQNHDDWAVHAPVSSSTIQRPIQEEAYRPEAENVDQQECYPYEDQTYHDHYPTHYSHMEHHHYLDTHNEYEQPHYAQIPVPQPEISPDDGIGEKERIRRAEERLLPSQPPIDGHGPSSSRTVVAPSAPLAPEANLIEPVDDIYGTDTGTSERVPDSVFHVSHDNTSSEPSAPAFEEITGRQSNIHATDDKQELQRQRLLAEASTPSRFIEDDDDNAGEGSSAQHEPSAPILAEEDFYSGQYPQHSSAEPSSAHEVLPQYER